MSTLCDLFLLLVAGATGGFLYGLVHHEHHVFRSPFRGTEIEVGVLGDMFAGCCGSIGIFLVAGNLLVLSWEKVPDDTGETLKVLALGVVTGFAGLALTRGLSSSIVSKVEQATGDIEALKRGGKLGEFYDKGILDYADERYDDALESFNKIRDIEPHNVDVLLVSAKALKRLGKHDEAADLAARAVGVDPKNHRARYNLACYRCLASHELDQVLGDLKASTELNAMYIDIAKHDSDLDRIKDTPEFKAIVGEVDHLDDDSE